jgi:rubrerythrin
MKIAACHMACITRQMPRERNMTGQGINRMKAILREAILAEQAAYDLYDRAMGLVKDEQARTVLKELRDEERLHREMLEGLQLDAWDIPPGEIVKKNEVTIADFLVGGEIHENADFQQVLLFAVRKEKGARDFYAALAKVAPDGEGREFFQKLARMEETHRTRCEALYWETYSG